MSTTGKKYKKTNIWKLNNKLLNNQLITEEVKKEIKICIERNENENMTTQDLWDSVKSSTKREIHSNTSLPQEIRETLNNHHSLTHKETRKRRMKKMPKLVEGKKNNQSRNQRRKMDTIEKINFKKKRKD